MNWDPRHRVPVVHWRSLDASWPTLEGAARHVIEAAGTDTDHLRIDSLLTPGDPASRRLIVALHGAIRRDLVELPRYEWATALAGRSEHKLYIADTTLELDESLTLAWYIGDEKDDLTSKLARYISHVCTVNNIEEVVLMGSSGGGYAALAIGSLLQNSCAVAYSPQTDVWKFSEAHTAAFLRAAFTPGTTVADLMEREPTRFSLLSRFGTNKWRNSFIYYQNAGDHDHVYTHKRPFAELLGVRLPDGRTFNQAGEFITGYDGDGHVRPPRERMDEFLDDAFARVARGRKYPVRTSGSTGELFDHRFHRGRPSFEKVPREWNSYYQARPSSPPPESATLAYDARGVPLRIIDGEPHDHPVLQAQFILNHLNGLYGDGVSAPDADALLARLEATAERLLDHAEWHGDALYFPFGFPWHQGRLRPPWYSAMAQGQVLQALTRLYEVTGDERHLKHCRAILRTFTTLPSAAREVPYIVHIDENDFLWLEEYPYPGQGKLVLNGHVFAMWGLYDYWRVTGDEVALTIAEAALATVREYVSLFRNQGWASHYNLWDHLLIRNYHRTHIMQLEVCYNLTGDTFFARAADTYERDFPFYQLSGSMYLATGTHVAAVADNSRVPTKITDRREVTVDKPVAVPFAVRTKIESEDGIWLHVEEGDYKGLWFLEEPKVAFPRLCVDKHYFPRRRSLVLADGTHVFNAFNQWGSPIDPVSVVVEDSATLPVRSRALWNGVAYLEVETRAHGVLWYERSQENSWLM